MNKEKFCIRCFIKRKKAEKSYNLPAGRHYDNGAALTPPMGWSSWNAFRQNIDEKLIEDIAAVMRDSGLAEAGYVYVNLDDCWHSSMRDKNGRLQGDLTKFPSGIKSLCEKVNAMGLKLGIYTSNGTLTCEDLPASLGHEAIDADTFAQWGIEFFKYDFCHNVPLPTAAPDVDKIFIGKGGEYGEKVIEAETAVLIGGAKICEDKKLQSGKYVTGLSLGGAMELHDVEVPEDGEYVLTIGLRKRGEYEKFLTVTVNGTDVYDAVIPSTKSWTPVGRHQLVVKLRKGTNTIRFENPISSKYDSAAYQYMAMGRELKRATAQYAAENGTEEKPIVYSICEWGRNKPWQWGRQAGNLWRTTPDIMAKWISVVGIYEVNVRLAESAGPGGWNDPDMLEVGNGKLTFEENKAHFSLWCMMAAPLILGNDLREFRRADGSVDKNNKILKLLTNRELIAIDQDILGVQCKRFKNDPVGVDILVKPLADGGFALCFFNKGATIKKVQVNLKDICKENYISTPSDGGFKVTELWEGTEIATDGELSADIPTHGVKVYKVTAKN